MEPEELKKILDEHLLWISDSQKGVRANLYGANLEGANLEGRTSMGRTSSGRTSSGRTSKGRNEDFISFSMHPYYFVPVSDPEMPRR